MGQKNKWSDLSLLLKNNTLISLKGADNDQSLRGVGLNFIVLDEFADIKPQAWYEVFRPTLSDTLGHALFCSSLKALILLMIYLLNKTLNGRVLNILH